MTTNNATSARSSSGTFEERAGNPVSLHPNDPVVLWLCAQEPMERRTNVTRCGVILALVGLTLAAGCGTSEETLKGGRASDTNPSEKAVPATTASSASVPSSSSPGASGKSSGTSGALCLSNCSVSASDALAFEPLFTLTSQAGSEGGTEGGSEGECSFSSPRLVIAGAHFELYSLARCGRRAVLERRVLDAHGSVLQEARDVLPSCRSGRGVRDYVLARGLEGTLVAFLCSPSDSSTETYHAFLDSSGATRWLERTGTFSSMLSSIETKVVYHTSTNTFSLFENASLKRFDGSGRRILGSVPLPNVSGGRSVSLVASGPETLLLGVRFSGGICARVDALGQARCETAVPQLDGVGALFASDSLALEPGSSGYTLWRVDPEKCSFTVADTEIEGAANTSTLLDATELSPHRMAILARGGSDRKTLLLELLSTGNRVGITNTIALADTKTEAFGHLLVGAGALFATFSTDQGVSVLRARVSAPAH